MCGAPRPSPAPPSILFFYGVTVPMGSIATVVLPTMGHPSATIDEANLTVWGAGKFVGGGISGVRGGSADAEGGTVSIEVGGGSYSFRVHRRKDALDDII